MFFDKKTLLKIGLILGGHLSRNRARLHAGQDHTCFFLLLLWFVCFVLFFNFINTLCLSTASNGLSLDLGKVHLSINYVIINI